ncbi:penicillin acylase family protein [Sinirhodobacter ferrireducens]|uniref:Penicillin acylase family protein n=1 Tax=Paenirhodobacter ferrireducens TaxID=1215032 RepID=A0A443L8D3_9RHOB|nr:penicillin acylase family protein [Sinirhodobacter ferrireducens]RWR45238.1 penicillin acylase family protein [Sinirhodobacter ferrireducens]
MFTLFRWMVRLVTLALVALVLVGLGAWYFASRSLPDYNASYSVSGISAPVEIVRSTEDVPHIFGKTDADVFFALGLAHAQDRLWQMTVLRRTVQGRLSEVFGAETLKTDELMRRLDLYGAAVKSVAAQDEQTKAALEAYARGVNAWIEQVNKGALGRGAPEFFLFKADIAYWTPADSIAILKLLAAETASQVQTEVLRARVSMLGQNWVKDILPDVPGAGTAALPDYASLFPGLPPGVKLADAEGAMSPFPPRDFAGASNAIAAAPRRSAAGGTLLANDPHMAFTAPSWWYLARLELSSGGVIGATIPGIPLVLSGRNPRLGWGITSAHVDDQDLHIEELNPADPERYRTPDGWKAFDTRRAIIEVKDAQPVTITLRWTDNGPVLPAGHFNLAAITPPGDVVSLNWTALDPADTSMSAGLALMQAGSVEAAVAAGERYIAPAENLILADEKGVGMVTIGAIPARDPGHTTQGRMPSPGWETVNRWQGRLPYADNPRFLNPEGGIVINTNNKMIDRPFPYNVSFDWGDSQRVLRLTRLMGEREVHSRESFISAQLDTVSPAARNLLPLVGKDLWFTGEAAPEGTPERLRQRALELLAAWDGDMNEHLPEPLIYAAWMRHLQNRLIRDELGPLANEFPHLEPLFIERVFRNTEGASRWCDVMQSAPVETCTDIARISLDEALLELKAKYGPNIESWRWGDAHEALHDHAVLGKTPILNWLMNIRQSTSGGDFTLNRGLTSGTGANPFANVNGAGYRGVYDFADPDSSVFIIATGQSGHPLSRHYDDLSDLWRRGEYIPMSLDPDLARAAAAGITRLEPAAPDDK